jgi:hypothetical protein
MWLLFFDARRRGIPELLGHQLPGCRARLADEHTARSMSAAFSRNHFPASAACRRPRAASGRS